MSDDTDHAIRAAAPELSFRRTQAERRAESQQRILDAAILTIGEKGSIRTSLADVGEAAGYSRGLPAHLFGNKDNLIVAAAQSLMLTPPSNTLFAVATSGGVAEMLRMLREWFLIAKDQPQVTRGIMVLWSEGLTGDLASRLPELHRLLQTIDQAGRSRLRHSASCGELRDDVDIETQPVLIIGAVQGILWQWMISPYAFDLMKTADAYLGALRRTLYVTK
jgi:AcrR family transcriptional regulator